MDCETLLFDVHVATAKPPSELSMTDDTVRPHHTELVDVTGERLTDLLRSDDPRLAEMVAEMVSLVRAHAEGTLAGWNNFYADTRPGSD
ncbi:hypothetical protein R8Z50_21275 [Longispora sp. K20-0274]|uniref:hypothetical protein n=1 Tax=Longispora sp. K20-0274 TaxID=3088255 RepID=UPI00399A57D1